MPLRNYRPTSPGLRQMTRATFEEITTDRAAQAADRAAGAPCRSQQPGQADRPPPGRRPQAAVPDHRLEARQVRRPGAHRDGRVRPEPLGAHRPPALRRRREALHAPAARPGRGRHRRLRRGCRGAGRQRAAAVATSRWAPRSTTSSWSPGAAGRSCAAAGSSAQLLAKEGDMATIRLPSGEVRRVRAECMATVGQVSNLDHENQNIGKAGRCRHMGRRPQVRGVVDEPERPPARWWRGQVADRHAAQDAVGQAGHGPAHPQAQATGQADRPPSVRTRLGELDESLSQEGTVRRGAPARPHRRDEQAQRAQGPEDLVARQRDLPADDRAHHRRPRRPAPRAGVRHREHGRPSAGRVRPDPSLTAATARPPSAARR